MTITVSQKGFQNIRVTHGSNLIYIQQGESKMLVLEQSAAQRFAQAIRAETPKSGSVEDKSAAPKACAREVPNG